MIRKLTFLLIYLALTFAVVHADQTNQIPSPLRGFAGYAYDSGMDAIHDDMKSSGYALIDHTDSSLWYEGIFMGVDCQLGYIFTDRVLIGGAIILESATRKSFALVNNGLLSAYQTHVEIETSEDLMVATIKAPDSIIIQTLDLVHDKHEVEYVREEW